MVDLIEKLKRGCEWQPVGDGSDAIEPNTEATNEIMSAAAAALEAAKEELKTVDAALERTIKREAKLRAALENIVKQWPEDFAAGEARAALTQDQH